MEIDIDKAKALQRINMALRIARRYGQIEGDHHRLWVIDQMVRVLTHSDYSKWVQEAEAGIPGIPSDGKWESYLNRVNSAYI